jgi:hypothetical protein
VEGFRNFWPLRRIAWKLKRRAELSRNVIQVFDYFSAVLIRSKDREHRGYCRGYCYGIFQARD